MLDDYISHIIATQNKSMLARIYGIFSIKTNYFDQVNLIIMQNSCVQTSPNNQKISFDLKGSLIDRQSKISYG